MTGGSGAFALQPRAPVAVQVYEQIRRAIVTLRLQPGEAVSEKELALRFGVSRTPCREALIRLAEDGLVTIYAQRGTVVAPIDPDGVAQAQFIREVLEVAVIEELARRRAPLELAGLERLLAEQRRAAEALDHDTLFDLDEAFHRKLCALAGREPVWPLVAGVKTQMDRVRYLSLPDPARIAQILDEHAAIVTALARRDAAAAAQAMRLHLRAVLQSIADLAARHAELFARARAGVPKPG